jgi:hypothetical protein
MFEGVIISQMPDSTPILAHVGRTSGEVEELPLLFLQGVGRAGGEDSAP